MGRLTHESWRLMRGVCQKEPQHAAGLCNRKT